MVVFLLCCSRGMQQPWHSIKGGGGGGGGGGQRRRAPLVLSIRECSLLCYLIHGALLIHDGTI